MLNFSQVLLKAYKEAPDRAAIHLLHSGMPDQAVTYRELLHASYRYATALQAAGVQAGEVSILILQHGIDLVAAFFGAILQGAIPAIMPFLTEKLLPEQYRASLEALFEITAPAAVITYPEFASEVRSAAQGTSVRSILISEQVSEIIWNGGADLDLGSLGGLARRPNEVVLLQHSSGTTGLQKGVALSHQAVFNQLESISSNLHLSQSDVIVSWLPLYHDMGLIAGFILPILRRVPLVLMSPFDWVRAPYRLLQALSHYGGTLCWLPNFAYNFCAQKVRQRDLEGINLTSVRAIINCSEPMYWMSHVMFLERFQTYGLRPSALATSYAMAENVFAVTQGGIEEPVTVDIIDRQALLTWQLAQPVKETEVDESKILRMLSAGRAIEGTRLRILDPQGQCLPDRHVGEIALQSNCMLSGYYHRPDLTKKAFREGWYLTGDLGYMAGNELYVTGRKKDLIIVGGKNIYPQDLENLAGEVKGVHPGRIAAFGVFNEQTGTEDVVIIAEADFEIPTKRQPENTKSETEREKIAAAIRLRVTRGTDVAVRYVHVVGRNWLAKTSSGKVARQENKARYLKEISAKQ